MSVLASIPFLGKLLGHHLDQIMVIDLSTPTTKAILLRRNGEGFALVNYCFREAPSQAPGRAEGLIEHLKRLRQSLGAKTRDTILVTGMEDSTLRNLELAPMESSELRQMLKLNSRHFFQQDMPGFV